MSGRKRGWLGDGRLNELDTKLLNASTAVFRYQWRDRKC